MLLSTCSVACTTLIFVIAAAPLLVVAACGIDKGLKGRVMYHITLTCSCLIGCRCMWYRQRIEGACYVVKVSNVRWSQMADYQI